LKRLNYTPAYTEVIYRIGLNGHKTGDGVYYIDNALNYEELNEAIKNMKEEM